MSLIAIDHLVKDYGAVRAVDDLSFNIEAGTIAGFLGPNGSGKTTTLSALLGLVEPSSGSATIDGRPYAELANPLREVGAMLAATAHPARSARGHLRIAALEAGVPKSRVEELLKLVELDSAAGRRVGGYSLGMRQRLGLAGALIGDPRILVLDEPANGLDPEGVRWLRDFLVGLAAEGRTILLSSHVLAEVAQTVDEVVVIAAGKLIVHAPLAEVMRNGDNRRVRVRTPKTQDLLATLLAANLDAVQDGAELVIDGGDQAAIAELAFNEGFALHEITSEASSLEDVFLDLTATPEEAVR